MRTFDLDGGASGKLYAGVLPKERVISLSSHSDIYLIISKLFIQPYDWSLASQSSHLEIDRSLMHVYCVSYSE